MLIKKALRSLPVVVVMAFLACGGEQYSKSGEIGEHIGQKNGALKFSIESAHEGIVGFKFNIYRNIEAKEMPQPLTVQAESPAVEAEPFLTQTKMLDERVFPLGLRQSGENNRFSDAYFVLPADTYDLEAIPLERASANSEELVNSSTCSIAKAKAISVQESTTTEIFLVSNCQLPETGGLDVGVLVNGKPIITNLTFKPSKFIDVNQLLTITVTAVDQEMDNLSYKWEIVNGKKIKGYSMKASNVIGNEMSFTSSVEGMHKGLVTVCDQELECSSLSFPIYVGSSFSDKESNLNKDKSESNSKGTTEKEETMKGIENGQKSGPQPTGKMNPQLPATESGSSSDNSSKKSSDDKPMMEEHGASTAMPGKKKDNKEPIDSSSPSSSSKDSDNHMMMRKNEESPAQPKTESEDEKDNDKMMTSD